MLNFGMTCALCHGLSGGNTKLKAYLEKDTLGGR